MERPTWTASIKSIAVAACIIIYLLLPVDTLVFKAVVDVNWIMLVTYLVHEHMFLLALRTIDVDFAMISILTASICHMLVASDYVPYITTTVGGVFPIPQLLDAFINARVLVIGCAITNPKQTSEPGSSSDVICLVLIAINSLFAAIYVGVRPPVVAIFTNATWEQIRLLSSFLCLRLTAGVFANSVVIGVTSKSHLRASVMPLGQLSLSMLEEDVEGTEIEKTSLPSVSIPKAQRPMPFAANLSLTLIMAIPVIFWGDDYARIGWSGTSLVRRWGEVFWKRANFRV